MRCVYCGMIVPKGRISCVQCERIVDEFNKIPTVNPLTAAEIKYILDKQKTNANVSKTTPK